jgi:hypothetical protein
MDTLRKPFLIAALCLIGIVVLIELGSAAFLRGITNDISSLKQGITAGLPADSPVNKITLDEKQKNQLSAMASAQPPGMGIPYMALVDGVALFTVGLMGASLIIPERIQGRGQGCLTFIFSLLIILAGIIMVIVALLLLITMISLLLSVPFGTLAYLALFGFFDTSGANIVLSLLMSLKFAFAICLLLAHPRFLQNIGLVLIILTSLLANIIIAFLHALVPGFLVSITDNIAAILMAIIAIIWAIILLIGSLFGIVRAVRLRA